MKNIFSRIFSALCFIAAVFSAAPAQIQKVGIASILPGSGEPGGWHQIDSARIFAGEDLYKFIDGGADIYFEYGFRQVISAEYKNIKDISIKLEIYEMTDDAAACGMYSINASPQGKKANIGNEAILNEYYLVFWKDKYLTFISSDDTTGETLEGILALAENIDMKIDVSGKKPEICKLLQQQDLVANKYVRGLLGLSSIYDFDTRNIFGVREGAIGIYRNHLVFLFKYDSEKDAEEWYKRAREVIKNSGRYLKFQEQAKLYTMGDQKESQFCVTHLGNLVIVVMADRGSNISALYDSILSPLKIYINR